MTTVQDFCDHIGIAPVRTALRAIDKYNTEHVWLVLEDGTRVYYHDHDKLDALTPDTVLKALGVGGIAWDGSDWEWGDEIPADGNWNDLDALREAFHDALAEHDQQQLLYEVNEAHQRDEL